MATARHHGRGEVVLRRQKFGGGYEAASNGSGVFDLVDRPLRKMAAGDAALLRIFRGTLIGSAVAAIGAVTVSAIW